MVKSVLLDEHIHERLIDLQDEIYKTYRMKITLANLIDRLIGEPKMTAKKIVTDKL